MGNNVSKRNGKKGRRTTKSMPPPRPVEDNEYSTNTTQSVSSILINSHHRHSLPARQLQTNNNQSSLAQLNPDYPLGNKEEDDQQDTIQGQDPFGGKVAHPQQHKLLAASDFWPPQQQNGDGSVQQQQDEYLGANLTVGSINQLTMNSIASCYATHTITPAELDDYIERLIQAGHTKVSKQLCLKQSEVVAICRAAMEIFLNQPVRRNKV